MVLPRIKGGWVGMMYALGVKDSDARLNQIAEGSANQEAAESGAEDEESAEE